MKIETYHYLQALLNWSGQWQPLPFQALQRPAFREFLGLSAQEESDLLDRSAQLNEPYLDVDEEIIRKINMLIGPHFKTIIRAYKCRSSPEEN